MKANPKKKRGPNGDRLKVEGNGKDAIKRAKELPANGWPERQTKKRKPKAKKRSGKSK